MELGAWLKEKRLSYAAFGRRIGESGKTVRKWCLRKGHPERRNPRADKIEKIARETKGAVQPNDFYDLSDDATAAAPERAA